MPFARSTNTDHASSGIRPMKPFIKKSDSIQCNRAITACCVYIILQSK